MPKSKNVRKYINIVIMLSTLVQYFQNNSNIIDDIKFQTKYNTSDTSHTSFMLIIFVELVENTAQLKLFNNSVSEY